MGNEVSLQTSPVPVGTNIKRSKYNSVIRKKITSKRESLVDDFIPPYHPKTCQELEFIKEALTDTFLYECLIDDEKILFVNAMFKDRIEKGVDIIKKGAVGDYFYLVDEGKVKFIVEDDRQKVRSRGTSFGELSLLYGCLRTATCQSITEVIVWKIHCKTFRHMMASLAMARNREIISILRKIPRMSRFGDMYLEKIAGAFKKDYYTNGTRIVQKGEVGEYFYIIGEGTVKIHDIEYGDNEFGDLLKKKGDYFGEMTLVSGEKRTANVTAITDCSLYFMSKSRFLKTVGSYDDIMESMIAKQILMSAPVFQDTNLEESDFYELVSLFEVKSFKAHTCYQKSGETIRDPGFKIIREGRVRIIQNNGIIADLIKGNHFGGQSIKCKNNQKSDRTIEFMEPTRLAILSKNAIQSVLPAVSRLSQRNSVVKRNTIVNIHVDGLNQHHIIGRGQLSTVRLVTHRHTSQPYALKIIPKREIICQVKRDNLVREKNLLISLANNPFIAHLITTSQDEQNVYFLFNFIQGGELFNVIHDDSTTGRSLSEALFYTSCMVLILGYLRKRHVCHRDIRPENILIDKEGYCVLIDFNEAKIVTEKSFTFCGSPEYLAPEMILYKGHDHGVDCWAIGILLYEMLTSNTPFYSDDGTDVLLFKRIVNVKYEFPDCSKFTCDVKDFLRRLLVKEPAHRLGCLADEVKGLRKHPFLKRVDWKRLESREIKSPWKPKIKGEMDVSNFVIYPEPPQVQEPIKSLTEEEQELFEEFCPPMNSALNR